MIRIAILFMLVCSQALGQSFVQFKPENMAGQRSYNYQHIINAEVSERVFLSNFSYLDSDYKGVENIYNIRNSFSYKFFSNWSGSMALGLKNPGFYATVSIQHGKNYPSLSYIIRTGLTWQKGFNSESFSSVKYTPQITKRLRAFIRGAFSFNFDKKGATRGVQQFRLGFVWKHLSFGLASNFDQFNYNQKTLQNHGTFILITF